jgi:predicted glycosyl hydrolase (DUF1957 family)
MNNQQINWVNFLHLYLPPTAEKEIIDETVNKSYNWILSMAEKYPAWHFTINITGCLTEALDKYGYQNILNRIKKLIYNGQIELVDSLSHHPIAPLISDHIVRRQITQQQIINKKYFNNEAKGFFLPEMAYDKKTGQLLSDLGYKWILLDEIHLAGKLDKVNWQTKYVIKNNNLKVIFRSREWSHNYPPKTILQNIKSKKIPNFLITATDAELYGHRFVDWEGWLGKTLELTQVHTLTISEYLKLLPNSEPKYISPITGNWESLENELTKKFPFSLWQHKLNRLHKKLWELARLATSVIEKNPHDNAYQWAQQHLDRGLASCTFWWASGRDFKLFGAPAWHPDEVEKGALELVKVIRTINVDKKTKLKAEKIYHKLKYLLWETHWNNYENK